MSQQMSEQEEYLFIRKSWNWQWPDDRGRWDTKAPARGPSQAYSGPSKGVTARRKTRRAKRRAR